jgi:hypothetical protein
VSAAISSRARDRVVTAARAAGALAVLALSSVALLDPDLPWHLAAARRLVETGSFPHADSFSWTMAGKPWVDFEWASELVFYGLERAGGAPALWLFRSALLVFLTVQFVGLLRLWKTPKGWDALAAPAFAGALFPLFGLRPELFSLVLFMLQFHLLERRRLGLLRVSRAQFLLGHAVLYAVWANLHAGFATGLLLCFAYGVGELFSGSDDAVPLPLLAACAGAAATIVNPYGVRLYAVLFDHWRHVGPLRRLIEEWRAPSVLQSYLAGYWLLMAFSFAGLLWSVAQGLMVPPEHLAAIALFGFFGSRSTRTTGYAVLVAFPLGLYAWKRLTLSRSARGALLFAALAASPFIAWRGFSWAGNLRFFGWPEPVAAQGPARAIAFLNKEKEALAPLHLYNPYNWGGCLSYELAPEYKVFIDGRYLFVELLDEVDRAQRSPTAYRGFMDAQGVDLAIVDNNGLMVRDATHPWEPSGRPYLAYAWPRVDWALVYWDSDAVILVRREKAPAAWLKAHEYRYLRPHDLWQLGLYIVTGSTPMKGVDAEIARYRREIGDPGETAVLDAWRERFKAAAPASGRR